MHDGTAPRTVFTTSRLLEFCTVAELSKLVGSPPQYWAAVIVKELIDNGLDAAEEGGVAPEITLAVSTKDGTITVTDNGPGIAPDIVTRLLDFRAKTSSREGYVGPTRGQQGNALQSLLAMPFALDGSKGETVIEAQGVAHRIAFTIDPIRREPRIEPVQEHSSVQTGTKITVHWPVSASSKLAAAGGQIVQIARAVAWLNPQVRVIYRWDASQVVLPPTDPAWNKWRASDPAPAHWYDQESLSRLIAAYVADDEDHGRDRTVREFVSQFRGLARSDAQKLVLDETGAARMSLREFFDNGSSARVAKLLIAMQEHTKPVAAKDLGLLGKDHFAARFREIGAAPETFQYRRVLREVHGVPYALEAAFGYCAGTQEQVRLTGINWSPTLYNPFRSLGHGDQQESLDALLADQWVSWDDHVVIALHLASPRLAFTDKAKTALALPPEVSCDLISAVQGVTSRWAKVRRAEERDASLEARRLDRLSRSRKESIRDVAFEVMEDAYKHASGGLFVLATQIMYAARNEIQERTGKQLDRQYFNQTLLPDFMNENPKLTADWNVGFDDRGHFTEPHTGHTIGLGTLAVRKYLDQVRDLEMQDAALAPAQILTRGPHGCYGGLFYCEKEGFDPLFAQVRLCDRFDVAPMSCKGMSVIAARKLADEICHTYHIPLFLLHDFDKSGFSILGTFEQASRRYTFENQIKVIDLGLRLGDIAGLQDEEVFDKGSEATRAANLARNGATQREIEFLLHRRVELNAMPSRQLVDFVERKLVARGIKKIVPTRDVLDDAYALFARGQEIQKRFKRELRKLNGFSAKPPSDLSSQVRAYLKGHPAARWDEAVATIAKRGR